MTRPWVAEDGALVRVRLVGGRLPARALADLVALSGAHGDGDVHLTARANLQVRGVAVRPTAGRDALPEAFVAGIRAAGLLPSTSHELVRNVMMSPLTGRRGGLADLRPVADALDALLLADPACARLPGRFLFVLDDGRGDLVGRDADLAAVALDAGHVRLRAGSAQWGPVLPLSAAAAALHDLARRFLDLRGHGPGAAWHVEELSRPLLGPLRSRPSAPDPATGGGRPPYGTLCQDDGRVVEHVAVPDGLLRPALAARVLARATHEVVVTGWRSLLLPDLEAAG